MAVRAILIWSAALAAIAIPLAVAATSPLLEWRGPVYVAAGLAGVAGLGLMLLQPLLAAGYLPGLPAPRGRRVHRWVGLALIAALAVHVGGLWITSPPDMVDALLLRAPAPFSAWGVMAMWALLAAALLVALRRPLRIRPALWRAGHTALVAAAAAGTAAHALLVEGTMGTLSKAALCVLVLGATAWAALHLRAWSGIARRRGRAP